MYQGATIALLPRVETMGAMTATDDRTQPPEERDDAPGAERPRWERAAELFVRWRDGEPRAMDELVRLMTPVLWHVARAYGLDRALAEDVVQSTWLALVRRNAAIEEPLAVSGWLTLCTRREAWRVGRLQRRADPTEADDLEPLLPRGESAEHQAQRGSQAGALWLAVGALNPRCQRLLRVVAFDERPDYARIAQDLAMPVGSIGPTRQRCLGKLRALLQKDGWEEEDHDR
ncbi:putative RNA polymerase sigma factor [Microbacterium sp. 8M]|nr:putative RNA polymerase sigma factor [Microbacterium sp. 8M]